MTRSQPTPFRVLVTGSRDWRRPEDVHRVLETLLSQHPDLVVVHGACSTGADALADRWARYREVSIETHPARWTEGRGAGLVRNQEMVNSSPDFCAAFIRDHSRGATHCAKAAQLAGIPTVVFRDNEPPDIEEVA